MSDLAYFDHILSTTRSVRRRLDFARPVPDAVLLECIDVATQAPTGAGGEHWRFLIVRDTERKQALATLYRDALAELATQRSLQIKSSQHALVERLHQMPALVFVCVDQLPPLEHPAQQVGFYGSILPAAWSLMLAMRARGIGTTWTSLLTLRQDAVKSILELPADAMQLVMLPAAYVDGARLRRAERRPAATVTYWDRWGAGPTASGLEEDTERRP